MRIGLDYDGTYTRDPELWDKFVMMAELRGHEVVCITMRYETEPVFDMPCEVVYTGRQAKISNIAGCRVDIWIDDNPQWILKDS